MNKLEVEQGFLKLGLEEKLKESIDDISEYSYKILHDNNVNYKYLISENTILEERKDA